MRHPAKPTEDAEHAGPQGRPPGPQRGRPVALLLLILVLALHPGASHASKPGLCDKAAARAAGETGVPLSVLRAVTRTETGRARNGRLAPWPWTVNMEGTGRWFGTRAEARAYATRHYNRGARSFDIGCFQINYKWHGSRFGSIDEMFDPLANARYAARFLARLHDELGDWSKAAGAYHSRTPAYAKRYRARFDRIRNALRDAPMPIPVRSPVTRPAVRTTAVRGNRFPLLQGRARTSSRGSLVPLEKDARRAFILMSGDSEQ